MDFTPLRDTQFRQIVDRSPAYVYVKDLNGRLVYVNAGVERLLGRPRSQLLGLSDDDLHAPQTARTLRANDREVARSARSVELEENIFIDGEPRSFISLKFPLLDGEGHVSAVCGISTEITARRNAEQRTSESESRFRELVERSLVGVYIIQDGRFTYVNPRLAEIFGYGREEIIEACSVAELVVPDDRERVLGNLRRRMAGEVDVLHYGFRGLHRSGRHLDVEVLGSRIEREGSAAVIGTLLDLSQRNAIERQNRLSAHALAHTSEGVMILDDAFRVVSVNNAVRAMTGLSAEQFAGLSARQLITDPGDQGRIDALLSKVSRDGHAEGEVTGRRRTGEPFPVWAIIDDVPDPEGGRNYYVAVVEDISERRAYEAQLEHLAHHDRLTGLPNRTLFHALADEWLGRAARDHEPGALLFVDLDGFKDVNDSLGHSAGDSLLREVAARLRAAIRRSDTIARLGGDEFALIMPGVEDAATAGVRARGLLDAFGEPFTNDGHELFTTASIGISLYPQDGEVLEQLLSNADAAMYEAKASGRNTYQFYQRHMNDQARRSLFMANQLRLALEREEFRLVYQPVHALADGRVTGAEALLRWESSAQGLIMPADFIPLAERTGLIGEIGDWALDEACRQIAAWDASGFGGFRVAVNLSARQLQDPRLAGRVQEALTSHGVDAGRLELEITETAVMQDPERVQSVCAELRALDVGLAIDDFGTGYSSLTYLKDFPVSRLKLDGSFVRGLPNEKGDAAITAAVIGLAGSLGLGLVAECIETDRQRDHLLHGGCPEGQGYLFAPPLDPEGFRRHAAGRTPSSETLDNPRHD